MPSLIVVDRAGDRPAGFPGVEAVTARQYLLDPTYAGDRTFEVSNLCRSQSYLSLGYYVSLLGEGRGQRPRPRGHQLLNRRSPAPQEPSAGLRRSSASARPRLAILVDPEESEPPSDAPALACLADAARRVGFDVEVIGQGDCPRMAEYDALFLRVTTAVEHYTYALARRAAGRGLVVIDDPQSIVRCTNKVYQAEALRRAGVPVPRTWIIDREAVDALAREVDYPCVLKRPDGFSSQGVARIDDEKSLRLTAREFLASSALVLAQEFVATDFDWRIGIFDQRPLFAARYPMVRGHWQIVSRDPAGRVLCHGGTEAVALAQVPPRVIALALTAAAAIGDGLYGVDLKQREGDCRVIEVNDNPNLDFGCEDGVLGEALYRQIAQAMLDRLRGTPAGRQSGSGNDESGPASRPAPGNST